MREIFTYGSVGGAPGNRCFYPEMCYKLKPQDLGIKKTGPLLTLPFEIKYSNDQITRHYFRERTAKPRPLVEVSR